MEAILIAATGGLLLVAPLFILFIFTTRNHRK